jgi:hypothetical protein
MRILLFALRVRLPGLGPDFVDGEGEMHLAKNPFPLTFFQNTGVTRIFPASHFAPVLAAIVEYGRKPGHQDIWGNSISPNYRFSWFLGVLGSWW